MFKKIPTFDYQTKEWSYTEFKDRESYVEYLWSQFKEPGLYQFDESVSAFRSQAEYFDKHGAYCFHPSGTKDFTEYWDTEKYKNQHGIIIKNKDKEWIVVRDYYFFLNFLKLYVKQTKSFSFPSIRDVNYHIALYDELAEYSLKNVSLVKKRQCASSYFHAAKLINRYYFEDGWVNKIGGALKDYINEKGLWRYLEEQRNFLNKHTAWYRHSNPDKILNWEQKVEILNVDTGRKEDIGNKSAMIGLVLDKNPTSGVGGYTNYFYHEEAGAAPRMLETIGYLLSALEDGDVQTGMFLAAGSVGELKQAEALKKIIYSPDSYNVLSVPCRFYDKYDGTGQTVDCGLFIPEQWSMPPYIDEYGNSLVEVALEALEENFEKWEKELDVEEYRLRRSQRPRTLEEAFDYREESIYPQDLIAKQIRRIEDGEYWLEYVDLDWDDSGKVTYKRSNKKPIYQFPVPRSLHDKEGVVVIHEHPVKEPQIGRDYYASLDPVAVGQTTTSDSLCSIYIYKVGCEVSITKEDGTTEHRIEQDKIVAWWCGRFDDLRDTHDQLEKIIEYYQAWTLVENNISSFIQHMQDKRKQKFLVPKDQFMFVKDLQAKTNMFQDYGWRNVGTIFKEKIRPYGIEFLKEPLMHETKPDGTIVKTTYGIERIPDIMLLKEMKVYREGLNVDRIISFCALAAFAKIQSAFKGISYRREKEEENLQNSDNLRNLNTRTPFRNMGRGKSSIKRTAFKNMR